MSVEDRAWCEVTDGRITIGNRWLRRRFRLDEGCATVGFEIRPWGSGAWLAAFSFGGAAPLDAEVVVDGRLLRVGPWRHEHYGHTCDWTSVGHEVVCTATGVRLDIRLRPRGVRGLADSLELVLH